MSKLPDKLYDTSKAVAYAHKWANKRNPRYYNFADIGGDCANFASQCIFAGCGVMNYRPLFGWYYSSVDNRTPSWSGVKYLYNFLVANKGVGPRAKEVEKEHITAGDIIQIATFMPDYHHTLIVVKTGEIPDYKNILVAAHSYDSDNRPLESYAIKKIRMLHINEVG